ncbi:hypothetical protein [Streptomyces sp. H39-S7]|uniref:hypothetical protein n=1 Tax=Streptomyces sp. H39-S7 TaxID=3004357 RepID=UPI0022AF409B|nr:hypothetical protein [Streptomyces sp. H39-S7]MCZ4122151.1 hypothetical protein [Streptomyces sp. H39-S7]
MHAQNGGRRAVRALFTGLLASAGLIGALITPAQAATAPVAATSYRFASTAGDYIGQGRTASYSAPAASVTVMGTGADLTVRVVGGGDDWRVELAAPRGDTLRPGVYRGAERAPFRTGRSPGLDVGGDGRGCNEVYGQFAVNQIATDASGAVTLLDASFTQNCEQASAPALTGTVKYHAFPLSYSYSSDAGDWIGGGKSTSYTGSTSTFTLSGSTSRLQYGVSGKRDDWTALFDAPSGQQLTAGTTYQATGVNGDASMMVFGDGRACTATGTFTISKLVTDAAGNVTALAATFVQHCDGGTPALRGTIHYNA